MLEDPADADPKPEQQQSQPAVRASVPDRSKQNSDAVPAGEDTVGRTGVIVASTALEAVDISEVTGSPDFSVTTEIVGHQSQYVAASYEGPLPPPAFLKGYEDLSPGAATEIISWVKTESQHRRRMELADAEHRRKIETDETQHRIKLETRAMDLGERALNSGISRAKAGMFLAWPLVITIVAAGTFLIAHGHDTAGTILVESTLLTVVGAYILNQLVRPRGEKKPSEPADESTKDEK